MPKELVFKNQLVLADYLQQNLNNNQQKFRSFFAIDLSDDVHYETIKLIKYLKKQKHYQHIKWTKSENLHITMRFLGNISVEQYERIIFQVSEKIKDIKPFSISFTSLIVFPSPEKPVAVALKPDPLAALINLRVLEHLLQGHLLHVFH